MLVRTFIILSTIFTTTLSLPATACPQQSDNPNAYIRRDNNRCEGIDLETTVSGTLDFISFTVNTLDSTWPSLLSLQVPTINSQQPEIELRAIGSRYRMDELDLISSTTAHTFQWPSTVLKRMDIPTHRLRATAAIGTSVVYLPVIINKPDPQYQFVFYSSADARFTTAEIRSDNDNSVIHNFNPTSDFQSGEHIFTWDTSNTPAGQYSLHYTVELDFPGGVEKLGERRITFEHDPAWLLP